MRKMCLELFFFCFNLCFCADNPMLQHFTGRGIFWIYVSTILGCFCFALKRYVRLRKTGIKTWLILFVVWKTAHSFINSERKYDKSCKYVSFSVLLIQISAHQNFNIKRRKGSFNQKFSTDEIRFMIHKLTRKSVVNVWSFTFVSPCLCLKLIFHCSTGSPVDWTWGVHIRILSITYNYDQHKIEFIDSIEQNC